MSPNYLPVWAGESLSSAPSGQEDSLPDSFSPGRDNMLTGLCPPSEQIIHITTTMQGMENMTQGWDSALKGVLDPDIYI